MVVVRDAGRDGRSDRGDADQGGAEGVVRDLVEEGRAEVREVSPCAHRVPPSASTAGGGGTPGQVMSAGRAGRAGGAGRAGRERAVSGQQSVGRLVAGRDAGRVPGLEPGVRPGAGHGLRHGSGQLSALPVKSVDVGSYRLIKNITVVIR